MTDLERQQQAQARAVGFWRRYDELEARLTRHVSERMLELGRVAEGMHVLDVACGRGEPAVPAAHRVGPHGRVLGVDLMEGMLEMARERVAREGLHNVELRMGDAQALEVGESAFDVALVRWGLMYMPEPERALASIHRALKPGGFLVAASWAEPDRVSYASLPRRMLEPYGEVPPLPGPDTPGVFRHADAASFEETLRRAGFTLQASEELETPVVEAEDGRGLLAWVRALGGPLMRLADELPEAQQRAWEEAFCAEVEKGRVGSCVTLGGVTRLDVARR
jgi:ubiquinone/menaquinone biosynthesis C-methylase UbiE